MPKHLLPLLLIASLATAAQERAWDFESDADGLRSENTASGIIAEPGNPANHVFQIVATQAHHTRLTVEGSETLRNFVMRFRVKVLEWTGAAPTAYAYGAVGKGGMRILGLGRDGGGLSCWYGRQEQNPQLGRVGIGYGEPSQRWTHVQIACYDGYILAKAWPEGQPEPYWQAEGRDPRNIQGLIGVGLWTSPRTPSTAKAIYDDLRVTPIGKADLQRFGIRIGPRPALAAADVPKTPGVFRVSGRTGLSTGAAAIAFDNETGEITNFVDLRTGRELVAREPKEALFDIRLTQPYAGRQTTLSSRDFRRVKVAQREGRIAITFSQHPALPIVVTATAEVRGDATRLGIKVTNPTDWCIASLLYPKWPAPPKLGDDATNDALVMPWHSGGVLPAPGSTWQNRTVDYPGGMFAQFVAYCGGEAGLYMAMDDSAGHCKRVHLRCTPGEYVRVTFEHQLPEVPRQDVELPYRVVLRTFQGDWRDAAAIYKQWAEQQPWCAKKLAERDDIPQFLKDGAGIVIAGMWRKEGRARLFGPNMEKLPDMMDAYRKKTGLKHMVFVPYGWEGRGTWAGINYFPTIPSDEAWVKVNAELKRRGHRTAFLTSGFWWVVKRKATSSGPAFDDTADFERRKGMCVQKTDGAPWTVDRYDRTKQFGSWRGLSAKLCHGSPEARSTMKEIFINVAKLGVPLVSFDQEIGGAQRTPCYSRSHAHPPGMGAWQWTGFRDLCADILREGKPVQPELGLFLENVSELAIPYMATYWSRQFGVVDVGAGGGRGIGLFSYLYHEYVTAIGAACVQGQGYHGARPHPGLRRYAFANNLVRGLIPGPFMHEVPLRGGDKWRREVASAFFSYCRPYKHFPEYLLLGKTVRPLSIECADAELYYWVRDSKTGKPRRKGGPPLAKRPLVLPAVTTGSFEAADGSVAAFVVNTTREPQAATVLVPKGRRVTVYAADRSGARELASTGRVALSLEPLGVRVLVMR